MSKITKCKICGADVATTAKACPACGGKIKKPFYKKWWVWVLAVIVIIGIGSSGGKNDVSVKEGNKTSENKQETTYNTGDVIATPKFEIKITEVKTATKVGGQFFNETPSEGGIFVIVNWECKNISDKPVATYSCPTIKLTDKNNTKYDYDISATSAYATEVNLDGKILSDLNPGINVKDAEVFEISEETYNEGELYVAVNADKDFKVKIDKAESMK